jgi:hypothetical protein
MVDLEDIMLAAQGFAQWGECLTQGWITKKDLTELKRVVFAELLHEHNPPTDSHERQNCGGKDEAVINKK